MAKASSKKWKTETKTVATRIIVGVTTAVITSAVIYFLGFNRSKKASELEIKKNTIQIWKSFMKLENELQPAHDTIFARAVRGELTFEQRRRQDSILSVTFVSDVRKLRDTPDIDADMKTLLNSRSEFKEEELQRYLDYLTRITRLSDTLITDEYRNFLIQDLNSQFTSSRDNAVERLGRTMDDMLQFLQKKFKYPFQIKDLIWYEQYLRIKTIRAAEVKPDVDLPGL